MSRFLVFLRPGRFGPPGPRNWRRELALVALYNTAIALFMTALTRHDLLTNFIFSQCIGLSISAYFSLLSLWCKTPEPDVRDALLAIPLGSVQGVVLGTWLSGHSLTLLYRDYPMEIIGALAAGVMFGLIATAIFYINSRLQSERLRRSEQEALAADAELRLLQARIEPHFLFNTLAVAIELIDTAPPQARQMLVDLVALLRGALANSRRELTTLDEELQLVAAYLDIMGIRMGERLRYRIEVPAALRQRQLPPLLLQPLVENAIRHGLEPLASGGRIEVRGGEQSTGEWWLEVIDTGRGLPERPLPAGDQAGAGIGLSNVRDRLLQRYGQAAALTLSSPPGGGSCIRLHFPPQSRPAAGAPGAHKQGDQA